MARTEKADVWMPLYIGDYLADTTRLTTEQHGAYLLLIMDYWRNGPPPDEKIVLQQVTRLTDFLWKKHWPVLQKFFTLVDGHWHHKRIDAEMAEALTGKASASEKARKAAEARWGKQDAPSNAQADAPRVLEESPSPSPSPSPTENPLGVVVVSGPPTRMQSDDFTPKNEGEWLRHLKTRHGFEADATDVNDRKRYWQIFSRWLNAGITTRQVDAAIAKSYADSTEPISNIVAYADRVLASMNATRTAPQHRSYHDERAETIAGLTGRSRSNESDDRTIDVLATPVARLAG